MSNKQNKTTKASAEKREQAIDAAPAPRSGSFAAVVKRLFEEGEIDCHLPAHFSKGSKPVLDADGNQRKNAKGNDSYLTIAVSLLQQSGGWRKVLGRMMPGQKAACQCERIACETAWRPHHQDHVRYGSRYVQQGSYVMGMEGVGDRQLFVTDLLLTKEVKDRLAAAHPTFFFVGGASPHSHPFCHISTQIASRVLIDRLVHISGDKAFQMIDLHGNPRSNARTSEHHKNLTINTIVEPKSAADCIRQRNKWAGAPYKQSSLRAMGTSPDPENKVGEQDAVISIHSGYYYDRREVQDCVALLKDTASFWMIMHKFPLKDGVIKGSTDDVGEFGHGEVKWSRQLTGHKDNSGRPLYTIRQWDALTGIEYVHNDNSHWFEQTSWTDSGIEDESATKGMAWDISACGPDTYLFQVVKCPKNLCWMEAQFKVATLDAVPVYANPRDKSITTGEVMPGYTVTAPKTFLAAKEALVGLVERDTKRWGEHVSRYRRLLASNKEQEDDLFAVALVCFFADVKQNREALMIGFVSDRTSALKAKRVTASKSDPLNWGETIGRALLTAASIVSVARSPPEKIVAEALGNLAHITKDYVP